MSRQTLLLLKVAEDEQAIASRLSKKFAVIDRNFVDNIDMVRKIFFVAVFCPLTSIILSRAL